MTAVLWLLRCAVVALGVGYILSAELFGERAQLHGRAFIGVGMVFAVVALMLSVFV